MIDKRMARSIDNMIFGWEISRSLLRDFKVIVFKHQYVILGLDLISGNDKATAQVRAV